MLTVKELQERRLALEQNISRLLNEFTGETGYSIEAVSVEQRASQGYYYGIYTYLSYSIKVAVDISTEYKRRKGALVKADTWIDEASDANR